MEKRISGERFTIRYKLSGNEKDALSIAKDICVEQTVEFPEELINDEFIKKNIIGKIESFEKIDEGTFSADISFAVETSSYEFTQFINVIFGNISLKPGIKIEKIILPEDYIKLFKGPRFGINGIRKILNIYDRPLVASAIKPMGMNTKEFSNLAYLFAKGGINIIKDDHGLSNQSFSLYKDRVKACDPGRYKNTSCLVFLCKRSPFKDFTERGCDIWKI